MSRSLHRRGCAEILVPCGVGELIDKITILEIKAEHAANLLQLENIRHELTLLRLLKIENQLTGAELDRLEADLKVTNAYLWDIEDALRLQEARGDFGAAFVERARQVYQANDWRAALKKHINILFNSGIVEEKLYPSSAGLNLKTGTGSAA